MNVTKSGEHIKDASITLLTSVVMAKELLLLLLVEILVQNLTIKNIVMATITKLMMKQEQ